MSKYALVFDGKIVQVTDKQFDVHANFSWADISSETSAPDVGWGATKTGDTWTFTDPNAETVASVQIAQKSTITAAYQSALFADISFTTAAGVTADFQSDNASRTALCQAVMVFTIVGSDPPAGFYWQAADNSQPVFTAADLRGLLTAIEARDQEYFQKLQGLKAAIAAATTIETVKAVGWGD